MLFLFIITISIVQGITEFLPISSSGHLILVYNLFGVKDETLLLSIILHLATLVSVIIYYRKDIWALITHPLCKTNKLLVVATIPTIIFVLIFKKLLDNSFGGDYIIYGFIITALILAIADYLSESGNKKTKSGQYITETSLLVNPPDSDKNIKSRQNNSSYERLKQTDIEPSRHNVSLNKKVKNENPILDLPLTYGKSIILGIVQGFACFPAISRSGSTISAGLMIKLDKETATKFSFLMSIPIIIASLVYEIVFNKSQPISMPAIYIILAFVITSIVGYFSILFVSEMVKNSKLSYFSYYLLALVFIILTAKFFIRFA